MYMFDIVIVSGQKNVCKALNLTNANSLDPETVNPGSDGGVFSGYNTVVPKVRW
jgi:hypothetical protein